MPKKIEKKRKCKEPKEKPAAKKAKQETSKTFPFELGANRFVEVKEFKGKVYVDVREKYEHKETAEMLPGKRGKFYFYYFFYHNINSQNGIPICSRSHAYNRAMEEID